MQIGILYNPVTPVKTFIRGLQGQLQNNIRLRNPKSLEQAMSFVIEEENFLYSANKSNNLSFQATFYPTRITPARSNNFQTNMQRPNNPTNFNHFKPFNNQYQNNFNKPNQFHINFKKPHQFQHSNSYGFRPTNFPFQKHPYFNQKPSEIRRNEQRFTQPNFNNQFRSNNQNSNFQNNQSNNNYPQPMDTSSGNKSLEVVKINLNSHTKNYFVKK